MLRFATSSVLVFGAALACLSCAGQSKPTTQPHTQAAETCSSVTQPSVAANTAEQLNRASNIVEYESTWRTGNPSAVVGTIDRARVASLIRAKTREVSDCYTALMNKVENGRGRVVVRFVIDASGNVPNVNVSSNDFDDAEVGCCLAKRVAQWSFPAPEAGDFVVVEYPFTVRISHSSHSES
jgi:hypothetical protein